MANRKQLETLKRGVDVWNEWRERQLDERRIWATRSSAELRNANLCGANLDPAKLFVVRLLTTSLMGCDLSQSWIGRTVFGEVDLRGVKGLDS